MSNEDLRRLMRRRTPEEKRDYTDNLYEQYLHVLDERDRAIERADDYEAVLRTFAEAEHDVCWNSWFLDDAGAALGRWGVEFDPS